MITRRDFIKLAAGGPIFFPFIFSGSTPKPARIGIISDTHIGAHPESQAHFWPMLKARPVDFWIVAGDVVQIDNGQWQPAKQQLDELGKPYYVVPGNHDLVYNAGSVIDNHYIGPAHQDGVNGWSSYFGPMRFVFETELTRFVGVNSLGWDVARQAWLVEQLNTQKRVVFIQHHPLVWDGPGWIDRWAGDKLKLLAGSNTKLVIAGHTHHLGFSKIGAILQLVCPAISYVHAPEIGYILQGGVWPLSYPIQGWLEITDTNPFEIEFYGKDGVMVGL